MCHEREGEVEGFVRIARQADVLAAARRGALDALLVAVVLELVVHRGHLRRADEGELREARGDDEADGGPASSTAGCR